MHSMAQQTASRAKENDDLGPVEITAQESIIAIGLRSYNRQKINALKRRPCYER